MPPEPQRKRTAPPPLLPGATTATARPRLNFFKLDISSLRKYSKLHRLSSLPVNASKDQLVAAMVRHFHVQPIENETRAITAFIQAVKRKKHATS